MVFFLIPKNANKVWRHETWCGIIIWSWDAMEKNSRMFRKNCGIHCLETRSSPTKNRGFQWSVPVLNSQCRFLRYLTVKIFLRSTYTITCSTRKFENFQGPFAIFKPLRASPMASHKVDRLSFRGCIRTPNCMPEMPTHISYESRTNRTNFTQTKPSSCKVQHITLKPDDSWQV